MGEWVRADLLAALAAQDEAQRAWISKALAAQTEAVFSGVKRDLDAHRAEADEKRAVAAKREAEILATLVVVKERLAPDRSPVSAFLHRREVQLSIASLASALLAFLSHHV